MEDLKKLTISSFNCRSVKSSLGEIVKLCENSDFLLLQEHWLLPHELNMLNSIHPDYLAFSTSAVDLSEGILVGRPYGGTAILYKKCFLPIISPVESHDSRVVAAMLKSNIGPILLVSVYMPNDKGDQDCFETYNDVCGKITAMYNECDAVNIIVMGDFNCQQGARFFNSFIQFTVSNKLHISDMERLSNVFTYCSDNGLCTSWIDHLLTNDTVDNLISHVDILYNYVTSDHKPVVATFTNLFLAECYSNFTNTLNYYGTHMLPDWTRASVNDILNYQTVLDELLMHVNIPVNVLSLNCSRDLDPVYECIDDYYTSIMKCVTDASRICLPARSSSVLHDYVIPGWDDIVSDKHAVAREAFLSWVECGKPRQGYEYLSMKKTRAQFKLSLRYCKQHEDMVRADACANSLSAKDYLKFWNSVRKSNNNNATQHAVSVGGCSGDTNVTEMWKQHFSKIYNSIECTEDRCSFEQRLKLDLTNADKINITAREVADACSKQKCGKAVGMDDIVMEAYINANLRLYVHLSVLFTLFIKTGYIPDIFMQSVFVPLVKNKTGDLSDVNNYRAIAISTALSKLLEVVISLFVKSDNYFDDYQFGFTAGLSTGLCTSVFKRTVDYYVSRGSHVFVAFIDFSKAFDRVNYWKMFHMLLDDRVNAFIVQLLSYWYGKQQACVRWHNCMSNCFSLGNGTRQGGVLSPWLFARYIRGILVEVVTSGVGCSIGNLVVNILAYADDMVLLAPSWLGLQLLLNIVSVQSVLIDMEINVRKTVCMAFMPEKRNCIVATSFPQFHIGDDCIQFVTSFKYLGHRILDSNSDNDDIQRETSNMYVRSNILLRRFSKCSVSVKILLFRSFCICLYDASLWTRFHSTVFNKLRSCYIRCMKTFFGYKRKDSTTSMLLDLGLPSFDTLMVNAACTFRCQWAKCNNHLIKYLAALGY